MIPMRRTLAIFTVGVLVGIAAPAVAGDPPLDRDPCHITTANYRTVMEKGGDLYIVGTGRGHRGCKTRIEVRVPGRKLMRFANRVANPSPYYLGVIP